MEQILAEYKQRALQYHPDKNPNDPSVQGRFLKLQVVTDNKITSLSSKNQLGSQGDYDESHKKKRL